MESDIKRLMGIRYTSSLKGVAILLVIFGHLGIIKHAGAYGVSIFLVVSGFGLAQSYIRKGLENFLSKRLMKVLFPYAAVTLIWIIIDTLLGVKIYFWEAFLSIVGANFNYPLDSSMWYITFIMLWYLVFYGTFKLIKSNWLKIIILFSFSIILLIFSGIFPHDDGIPLYVFYFPLGVIAGLFYSKIVLVDARKLFVFQLGSTVISTIAFVILFVFFNSNVSYFFECAFFAYLCLNVFSILSSYSINCNPLEWLGGISYEIYLIEYVFLKKYNFIFSMNVPFWVQIVIYVIFIFILGAMMHWVIKRIEKLR